MSPSLEVYVLTSQYHVPNTMTKDQGSDFLNLKKTGHWFLKTFVQVFFAIFTLPRTVTDYSIKLLYLKTKKVHILSP